MEIVSKFFPNQRRRALPEGAILLEDGKRVCEKVQCSAGVMVKDIIDQVCTQEELQIVPVARQFFALCDFKNGLPLCPYQYLTLEEARKKYQLRVFVNTGENSFQLLRMSKTAYTYYYAQLKEEFVTDRLYPRASPNTGIWMAAIDMALEAHSKDSDYNDIIRSSKDLLKFMPKFLKEKCLKDHEVEKKLRDTFQKFKDIRQDVSVTHYESKYMEVYEKDLMCGKHIFRLKTNEPSSRRRNQPLLAVVSCKEGIYTVRMGDSKDTRVDVCVIACLSRIDVDMASITLSIRKPEESSEQETVKTTLNFYDRKEAQSFAVIVHAYYQLLVNANDIILTGTVAPQEEFLRVGRNVNDGKKIELCHAPIPPQYVTSTLSNHGAADGMSNGNFLIRESRNTDNAYTLSVWYQSKVMNYRIVFQEDVGYSFQDPLSENEEPGPSHQPFPTLVDLINHHSQKADGLPAVLKMNYTPKITGPIPLLKQLYLAPSPSPTPSPVSLGLSHLVPSSNESSSATTPTSPHEHFEAPVSKDPFIQDIIKQGSIRYIEYNSLRTLKELGSGHYSTVYLAEWSAKKCKVAAKIPTMKEHNLEAVKKDLMREILTMSTLDHPHIVQLLGISDIKHFLDYIGLVPVVVMEFVDGGCLRTFLNTFKKTIGSDPSVINKTKRDFVLYGKQIAEGMNYLAQKKIVHRDLAARNVLLVSNEQIKISDFGLARKQLEESDYYASKGSSNDLPIYWYSPESLSTFKFSTKGDVWSYGVTLWEMFTLGDNPNAHLGPIVRQAHNVQMAFQALVNFYTQRQQRLPNLNCDKRVYSTILLRCWDVNPHSRPTFEELAKDMDNLYNLVNAAAAAAANGPTMVPSSAPQSTAPQPTAPSGLTPAVTPSSNPAPPFSSPNSTLVATPSSNSAPNSVPSVPSPVAPIPNHAPNHLQSATALSVPLTRFNPSIPSTPSSTAHHLNNIAPTIMT